MFPWQKDKIDIFPDEISPYQNFNHHPLAKTGRTTTCLHLAYSLILNYHQALKLLFLTSAGSLRALSFVWCTCITGWGWNEVRPVARPPCRGPSPLPLFRFISRSPAKARGQTICTILYDIHSKKSLAIFPSLAKMSLTKLSLAENNLIIPGQGEFGYSDILTGTGKSLTFFWQCSVLYITCKCRHFCLLLILWVILTEKDFYFHHYEKHPLHGSRTPDLLHCRNGCYNH